MKAIRIHENGGPDVLRYEDAPDPSPAEGEVLVRLRAAALNRIDLWIRSGQPSVPKPRILGSDGAGERLDTGERVVINPGLDDGRLIVGEHSDGTDAELIAVPEEYVRPIPDELTFVEAAAFPLVFETAYRMLVTKARLREGEWVLVWGIGGGVATASLAIAKAFAGRVLATSSSDAKLERARELGADAVVNHVSGDVAAAVKQATGGAGVDVVVEHVGTATWDHSLKSLAPGGRLVTCGATTGYDAKLDIRFLFSRQLSILGSYMGTKDELRTVLKLVAQGRLLPAVDKVWPLHECATAHNYLENAKQFGKVVLTVP